MGKNIENVMQLDYDTEISNIERQLKNVKHEIKYKVTVATESNFRSVIADAPFALHFSGHGVQNNRASLGTAYALYKDKGNILLLEDENCMAKYLFESDLKELVKISQKNRDLEQTYEVVFVSSCHSEFAGEIFLNSGARHVICIDQSMKVMDKASLRFSKVFYQAIFMKNCSICKAYSIAKDEIRTLFNSSEASKFKLLINHEYDKTSSTSKKPKHICLPLSGFKNGVLTKEIEEPFFDNVPVIDNHYTGRQKEMCEVISHLNQERVVSIIGPPGIGKISVTRKICSLLKDRSVFYDGILIVDLNECETCHTFFTRMLIAIKMCYHKKGLPFEHLNNLNQPELTDFADVESVIDNKMDLWKIRELLVKILHDKEVLLVLNHCEDILDENIDSFYSELNQLLFECVHLKILMTNQRYLEQNHISSYRVIQYVLHPLSNQECVKLLLELSPRKILNEEITELLSMSVDKTYKINDFFIFSSPESPSLVSHPFTKLLNGHPQAITLIASSLKFYTLKEIFEQLLESNVTDVYSFHPAGKIYNSVKLSLDLSLKHLGSTSPQALDLFLLLGMLPGGIYEGELTELWGDGSWKPMKHKLISASLVLHSEEEGKLSCLNYMGMRAIELLEEQPKKKTKFHSMCCGYYRSYLVKCLQAIEQEEFSMEQFVEREANIWACIYREINRPRRNSKFGFQKTPIKSFKRRNTYNKGVFQGYDSFLDGDATKLAKIDEKDSDKSSCSEESFEFSEPSSGEEVDEVPPIGMSKSMPFKVKGVSQKSSKHVKEKSPKPPELMNATSQQRKFRRYFSGLISKQSGKLIRSRSAEKVKANESLSLTEQNFISVFFTIEQKLVLTYISTCILLSKLSDASKAISEYSSKPNLSPTVKASFHLFTAILSILDRHLPSTHAPTYLAKALKVFNAYPGNHLVGVIKYLALKSKLYLKYRNFVKVGDPIHSAKFEQLEQLRKKIVDWARPEVVPGLKGPYSFTQNDVKMVCKWFQMED